MRIKKIIALLIFSIAPVTFADVPVIDLSQSANTNNTSTSVVEESPTAMVPETTKSSPSSALTLPAPPQMSSLTIEQRMSRLEQQMNNLTQMNLSAQIENLQQEIQKLNGQVEQQDRDIKNINDQLKNFYRDLDQRINQPKTTNENTGSSLNSASTSLPTSPQATASDPNVSIDQQSVPKEQKAYENAFNLLQQKKYSEAAENLTSYLKIYPRGAYAVNAHYWLAECYYLLGQFDLAANEFKLVIDKYPASTKIPDSMLKLGIIYIHNNRYDLARNELKEVQKKYPGSMAAQLAAQQLALMIKKNP